MKFNLKRGMAGMLVAASFVPGAFAFAEETSVTTQSNTGGGVVVSEHKETTKANNFCASLATTGQKLIDNINNAEAKQLKYWNDRNTKLENKQGDTDAKRADNRSRVDNKRVDNWGRMENKAKTDAQKAAVAAYTAAIKAAVDARRTSVDASVAAYRTGLTAVMATQSGAIDQALATFKASVDAALAKAKADCTANVASRTVRENFNKTVNDARKILRDVRKNSEAAAGIKALKATRDQAIKDAESAFRKATTQARTDLMAALKK